MSNTRQIIKNTFSLTAAELAAKGLGVFFAIYLMRVIGPENFGVFSNAKALVFGFIVIVYLGFEQIGIREVARDHNKLKKIAGLIFSIRIVLAIICTLALIIFLEFFTTHDSAYELRKNVTYIYGLLIIGNAFYLNWAFQAIEKMHIIAIRTVSLNLINLLGLLIFVHSESDFIIAVWIIVISNLLNLAWMLSHFIRYYAKPKLFINLNEWKSLSFESFRVGLIFLITNLNIIITLQVLTYYSGDFQTGIFSAAFQIMVLSLIPSNILQQAFFPQIARSISKNDRNEIVSKFLHINVFLGVFISGFIFVYSDLIILLLGDKYQGTNIILKIMAISVLIQYISMCYFSPLVAWKKETVVVWANIVGLVSIVIINFLFIPEYGYYGAAVSAVSYEICVLLVLLWVFKKEQGKVFIFKIAKVVSVGLSSFFIGYILLIYGMNIYLNIILTISLFLIFNFYFKIIKLNDFKLLFKK